MNIQVGQKVINFDSKPQTFEDFKKEICKAVRFNLENFADLEIGYTDIDGDEIQLRDSDDFEYFRDSVPSQVILKVHSCNLIPETCKNEQILPPNDKFSTEKNITIETIQASEKQEKEKTKMIEVNDDENPHETHAKDKTENGLFQNQLKSADISIIQHIGAEEQMDFEALYKKKLEQQNASDESVSMLMELITSQTVVINSLEKKLEELSDNLLVQKKQTTVDLSAKPSLDFLKKKPVNVTHAHVSCDVCRKTPLVGKRYTCLVCHNFDICENCEEQNLHNGHPMLRIGSPTVSLSMINSIRKAYLDSNKVTEPQCTKKPSTSPLVEVVDADTPEWRFKYASSKAGGKYHSDMIKNVLIQFEKHDKEKFMKNIDEIFK